MSEPERYIVKGQWATKPEWVFAQMLAWKRIPYAFQVKVFNIPGGVRGDYRLDFLVDMPPRRLPVEIKGRIWHTGKLGADDPLRDRLIAQEYGVPEVISIWEEECETMETAWQAFRQEAGGGL